MAGSPVLPLRPLTVSELLDAAAALLRSRWRTLLAMSLAMAAVEQIILTTLRMTTLDVVKPKYFGDFVDNELVAWLWIGLGLITQSFIMVPLAAVASRTAVASIKGIDPEQGGFWTLSGRTWGRVMALSAIVGGCGTVLALLTLCAVPVLSVPVAGLIAFLVGSLPWFLFIGVFSVAGPILVTDRCSPGRALLRTFTMLRRSRGRIPAVMLLSVLSWALISFVVTVAAAVVVLNGYIDFTTVLYDYFLVLLGLCYLAINTAAYAVLGCLAAALHIETRVRTEGLDIAISRMRARGEPVSLRVVEAR